MDLELVNVVAGGALDIEIDLHSAFEQIGASNAKYEPEIAPGLQLQLKGATIMLFHSGEYHLTGADSFENAREAARKLTEVLEKVLEEEVQQEHFEIRNLLYKGEFEIELDLEELHSDLPGKTEHHPENHPALYFRSDMHEGLLILFRTGKYTVTGITNDRAAEQLVGEFIYETEI
jgi:transcription initiation factor TFIID TATA-box-binding protein